MRNQEDEGSIKINLTEATVEHKAVELCCGILVLRFNLPYCVVDVILCFPSQRDRKTDHQHHHKPSVASSVLT